VSIKIIKGDCREMLRTLPDESVHCCVTSPPYFGLRDYGVDGQIGLEPTPEAFVAEMVDVFREVRRVLRADGTLWLNLGDSYNGSGATGGAGKQHTNAGSVARPGARSGYGGELKQKDLIGIPWMTAFALRADGWYLRQDLIWSKPNPMPESVQDRCTKAHEHIFLLSRSAQYFYDAAAIREDNAEGYQTSAEWIHRNDAKTQPNQNVETFHREGASGTAYNGLGRNKRSVWAIATQAFPEAHFATFPPALIEPCIKAGCPAGGTVLDPFGGAGTTGLVADRLGRDALLIELNPEYAAIAERRIKGDAGMFAEIVA
jgi:DNA modification methylase